LFPVTVDAVDTVSVERWLAELVAAGLVVRYAVGEKPLLYLPKFGQRVRNRRSKYPPPADGSPAGRGGLRPYSESESESESNSEAHSEAPSARDGGRVRAFEKFWDAYPKKAGRAAAFAAWVVLDPDELLVGVILAGVGKARRSAAWQNAEGRFVPRAAAWLVDRRWEEFATPPRPVPPVEPPDGTNAAALWRKVREIG
jgi:hypothetical protein